MRTILITGANRGIGLETAHQLAQDPDSLVLAAARNPDGAGELSNLAERHGPERLRITQLDVGSRESIAACGRYVRDNGIRLDVLINNAGVYTGGKNPAADAEQVMRVNYYGPKFLSMELRESMGAEGLVVNVSSGMGELSGFSRPAAEELLREDITESELDELANHYAEQGARGPCSGWISNPYSASKAVLNTLTRIRFRGGENMVSVCPGWVRTAMGGAGASRSVGKGAETIVWLARGGASSPGGKFYRDKREIEW